ncbi:MAG: AAA family ATPase [Deltaproteobacteria bacterium]|nr:AAA family ATPase [Deltaproteobacteria bacterium]MBW2352968.1 AAA family ATPase [Deltaproteobacteria bacterium]
MFPMSFDYNILESLPVPDEERIGKIVKILETIVQGRVMPYFRKRKGTDPTVIVRTAERLAISRLEDGENRIHTVSLLSKKDNTWTVHIHERIFDYLAFVIPSDPQSRLGGHGREEGKVLAFAEFLLRHEVEHMLYPEVSERGVVRSDVAFAMDRRREDPTYYSMLRNVLADEMNGLRGELYQALFESQEQGRPYEYIITRILTSLVLSLVDIPAALLHDAFPLFDTDLKMRIIVECYRRSREVSLSLMQRASCLQEVLHLFALTVEQDEKEAERVFDLFKDRWGLVYLFHELGLPETIMEEKEPSELFAYFKENLERLSFEGPPFLFAPRPPKKSVPSRPALPAPTKSLKDRIEEARNNPDFPRQALTVIDKNKVSAVGHSGPKYTELIETLLAIPWGNIQEIAVSPKDFEEGLNRTHYGLNRPKEIVCDLFANLIWRYRHFSNTDEPMRRTGSAFLFVGPPGVGKTSLAISIAENLGLPYHKVSLGGMRDEAALRGHGFTYEGSKPGAIVQGLIKMGIMNGIFIMDEADKTEPFAISTLLEILDPEQNHLFHDKFTMTTVDIDLSNCHFILTANTLETVPPPVINRCEVVFLDRYSVEEKVAIGREYLIERVRKRHRISKDAIAFDPGHEKDLLRYLIKTYTHEPGVRELERIIRTLFLRLLRKEILARGQPSVRVTREVIKQYLEAPAPPRQISEENRVGEMLALGVNVELGIGSIIPIQATPIQFEGQYGAGGERYLSMVHATGNIEKIMDESRKVATTAIFHCADALGIELTRAGAPVHLHFMGSSTKKDGPSAGGAIALALASALSNRTIRRDVAMTGEIDTQGRIMTVGGLDLKLETACDAGCKTMIIPTETLRAEKGVKRLPQALKQELQILTYGEWKGEHDPFDYARHVLQVVGVDHITQAADIAFMDQEELDAIQADLIPHARSVAEALKAKGGGQPLAASLYVLYLKHPDELDLKLLDADLSQGGQSLFLLSENARETILLRFPRLKEVKLVDSFDGSKERLSKTIKERGKEFSRNSAAPIRVSVVAPFFFLKRDGIVAEPSFSDRYFSGLRLFANNYTLQGVKIKGCKAVLNRVYHYLSQQETTRLDDCPFLGRKDGVYLVDLSFIPEKYRLDVKNAQAALNRSLGQWLITVEGPDPGR